MTVQFLLKFSFFRKIVLCDALYFSSSVLLLICQSRFHWQNFYFKTAFRVKGSIYLVKKWRKLVPDFRWGKCFLSFRYAPNAAAEYGTVEIGTPNKTPALSYRDAIGGFPITKNKYEDKLSPIPPTIVFLISSSDIFLSKGNVLNIIVGWCVLIRKFAAEKKNLFFKNNNKLFYCKHLKIVRQFFKSFIHTFLYYKGQTYLGVTLTTFCEWQHCTIKLRFCNFRICSILIF